MAGCGVPQFSSEEAAEVVRRLYGPSLTEGEAAAILMSKNMLLPPPKLCNFKAESGEDELSIGQFSNGGA